MTTLQETRSDGDASRKRSSWHTSDGQGLVENTGVDDIGPREKMGLTHFLKYSFTNNLITQNRGV